MRVWKRLFVRKACEASWLKITLLSNFRPSTAWAQTGLAAGSFATYHRALDPGTMGNAAEDVAACAIYVDSRQRCDTLDAVNVGQPFRD